MIKFKQYVAELYVRDAAGKKIIIQKQPVRMITGVIKKMYPAKSGSSRGGE